MNLNGIKEYYCLPLGFSNSNEIQMVKKNFLIIYTGREIREIGVDRT